MKLYGIPRVTGSSLGSEIWTTEIKVRACSPQVFCLRMNFRRGWNRNLEGSYLLEYSEYKDEFWTQCKLGFYLRHVKGSDPDPYPILRYSECTKMYQI